MHTRAIIADLLLIFLVGFCGCGPSAAAVGLATGTRMASPSLVAHKGLNGAVIVSLRSPTAGAIIHYTVDGSVPTSASPVYQAPFLVATDVTVKAYAAGSEALDSAVTSKKFSMKIPAGTLVWSDEFPNPTGLNLQPDSLIWRYDTGATGFGNHELENYCAYGSASAPCDPANPNAYVGTDGMLHIVARKDANGKYTSARMKSQSLFSLQYGRLEARIWVPEGQGIWPAFWTLGNNVATAEWPACGEQDIMERVNAAKIPLDWNEGSVHGPGFTGDVGLGTIYNFPSGQTAAGWHTYGIVWQKNSVAFYVDDSTTPYVTYTNPTSLSKLNGAVWPFDTGDSVFMILNVAVGGDWPGAPDSSTVFPAEMKVDYVRVYTN
jgi:beta-glucanase (GH16 family)